MRPIASGNRLVLATLPATTQVVRREQGKIQAINICRYRRDMLGRQQRHQMNARFEWTQHEVIKRLGHACVYFLFWCDNVCPLAAGAVPTARYAQARFHGVVVCVHMPTTVLSRGG